jgi:hypothetical protein
MRFWNVLFLGLSLGLSCVGFAIAGPAATKPAASSKTEAAAVGTAASSASVQPSAVPGPSPAGSTGSSGQPGSSAPADKAAATAPVQGQTSPAPAGSASDGATHLVRLRDLEQRVDELKEQIRRSHTRLSLLSDTILAGGVGGARAEITFINDLSSVFKLTRALFVLDGAVQNNKQDETGVLADQKEIPVFNGSIPPGDHTLQILLQLRGHGFGVFSYLQGYRFEFRETHSFTITEGKTIELRAIAFEQGGVTVPLEQRPKVRFFQRVRATNAAESKPEPSQSQPGNVVSGSFSVGAGSK